MWVRGMEYASLKTNLAPGWIQKGYERAIRNGENPHETVHLTASLGQDLKNLLTLNPNPERRLHFVTVKHVLHEPNRIIELEMRFSDSEGNWWWEVMMTSNLVHVLLQGNAECPFLFRTKTKHKYKACCPAWLQAVDFHDPYNMAIAECRFFGIHQQIDLSLSEADQAVLLKRKVVCLARTVRFLEDVLSTQPQAEEAKEKASEKAKAKGAGK